MADRADLERPNDTRRKPRAAEGEVIWYVAYGSNLARDRLRHYLAGGRPHGALRTYDGCRDTSDPLAVRPVPFRGRLLFAGRSRVWTGGMAFIDPDGAGTVAGRGYLLGAQQVNDLVAQELRLPFGTDLDLLDHGTRRHPLGTHGYDTALRLDAIEGIPAVTITSSVPPALTAPSAAYLWWVALGLRETYGWSPSQIAGYLLEAADVSRSWTCAQLQELARGAAAGAPADT